MIAKKIAISLEENRPTWYIADERTHGDTDVLMISIKDEKAGSFVVEPDDVFTGSPATLAAYVTDKYPHAGTIVIQSSGIGEGLLSQLKYFLANHYLEIE